MKEDKKMDIFHIILIIFAGIFVISGIAFAFFDLEKICIKIENYGYVGALFSIAGVILFFTALLIQVKEYKLQVQELKNSVKAQESSSSELEKQRRLLEGQKQSLEEQKEILLAQHSTQQILGVIESFNAFKVRNNISEIIEAFMGDYRYACQKDWKRVLKKDHKNTKEAYQKYAELLASNLEKQLKVFDNSPAILKFIHFAYNTLYLIEQCESTNTTEQTSKSKPLVHPRQFSSLFHCQQNGPEMLMIYIANLVSFGMPIHSKLEWGIEQTEEIIKVIYQGSGIDTQHMFNIQLFTEVCIEMKTK